MKRRRRLKKNYKQLNLSRILKDVQMPMQMKHNCSVLKSPEESGKKKNMNVYMIRNKNKINN